MGTALDLPLIAPQVSATERGMEPIAPVPHEMVEDAAYTVVLPLGSDRTITLSIAILNRCMAMASRAYYGPGWRRIELGLFVVAFKAVEDVSASTACPCPTPTAQDHHQEPDPSA